MLICNTGKFAGTIYAPTSKVVLSNGVEFVGAIAADRIVLENDVEFRLPDGLGVTTVGSTTGGSDIARWTECPATSTGTSC